MRVGAENKSEEDGSAKCGPVGEALSPKMSHHYSDFDESDYTDQLDD